MSFRPKTHWLVRAATQCGTNDVNCMPDLDCDQKAPRVVLYSNHGLVELGAYEINKSRRPARVPYYEWTPVSGIPTLQSSHGAIRQSGLTTISHCLTQGLSKRGQSSPVALGLAGLELHRCLTDTIRFLNPSIWRIANPCDLAIRRDPERKIQNSCDNLRIRPYFRKRLYLRKITGCSRQRSKTF
jgi:hypothetical protein